MSEDRNIFLEIFKAGSKTYFYSSKFFPKEIKHDVEVLYSFVRTVDDFVDSTPQKLREFNSFKKEFNLARNGKVSQNSIINEFISLEKRKKFNKKWANAFFTSMEMDLTNKPLITMSQIEKYIYGSAEVIGLFMSKIMNIDKKAYNCARTLGKAMQYINFIRDIDEDILLNRSYFPLTDYKECKIKVMNKTSMISNQKGFTKFIKKQLDRYRSWQGEAEKGYKYLPKKYLAPVKTAADMYKWTAKVIENNPKIVFKKKVKPSQLRILITGAVNSAKETSFIKEL